MRPNQNSTLHQCTLCEFKAIYGKQSLPVRGTKGGLLQRVMLDLQQKYLQHATVFFCVGSTTISDCSFIMCCILPLRVVTCKARHPPFFCPVLACTGKLPHKEFAKSSVGLGGGEVQALAASVNLKTVLWGPPLFHWCKTIFFFRFLPTKGRKQCGYLCHVQLP